MFQTKKIVSCAASGRCLRFAWRELSLRPTICRDLLHQLDDRCGELSHHGADFEFDSVLTDPIPDTDVQKGRLLRAQRQRASRWRRTSTR